MEIMKENVSGCFFSEHRSVILYTIGREECSNLYKSIRKVAPRCYRFT